MAIIQNNSDEVPNLQQKQLRKEQDLGQIFSMEAVSFLKNHPKPVFGIKYGVFLRHDYKY